LNQLLSRDLSVPVIKLTGGFPVQFGELEPMSVRISDRVSTKDRDSMAFLGSFAQKIVKARQHNVVLVQDMHPITSRALDASVPRIRQALVFGFVMEHHPPGANPASNFGSGIIVRTVIDYLDLHLVRPRILPKDARQRFLQKIGTWIVRWYHYRPERTRRASLFKWRYHRWIGHGSWQSYAQ